MGRHKGMTRETVKMTGLARRMRRGGQTYAAIARRFGVTHQYIALLLRDEAAQDRDAKARARRDALAWLMGEVDSGNAQARYIARRLPKRVVRRSVANA
ncbi:MAG TPA: hypothetical protein VKA94_04090 [Hyphomicrobiales bacterium]|nr:hypothetical protein [Hyphomicrobiales bacterium]